MIDQNPAGVSMARRLETVLDLICEKRELTQERIDALQDFVQLPLGNSYLAFRLWWRNLDVWNKVKVIRALDEKIREIWSTDVFKARGKGQQLLMSGACFPCHTVNEESENHESLVFLSMCEFILRRENVVCGKNVEYMQLELCHVLDSRNE